ncbi:MAG: FAD-dependent oxidoreductase [Propionibacteriaceae bacterium]|jgi:3-oxosteroid 1-dehydrogenase|nr:FAD-dependent oxidoreductase [Propionibacteriaceae bacterium]
MKSEYDLVVAGAGAAGLLAAAAATRLGYDVLVVEASDLVGGTNAGARGAMWLPGNSLQEKAQLADSSADALDYLNEVLGEPTEISTPARRAAFVETAPKLAAWLLNSRLPLTIMRGLPDHYPNCANARDQGRVLAMHHIDRSTLGPDADRLRTADVVNSSPLDSLPLLSRVKGAKASLSRGESLVAELFRRTQANGVEVRYHSPVCDLVVEDGRATGGVVDCDGAKTRIAARGGVLLACGGFEGDQRLREEHLPLPTSVEWSLNNGVNHGAALALAQAHDLATANLDDAWWVPVIMVDHRPYRIDHARRAAHSLLVDQVGDRFYNETAPAAVLGQHLYARSRSVRAVPSYLIMDARHRQAQALGPWKAGSNLRRALEGQDIHKASTLNELAAEIGVDPPGLLGSVVRFNGFAAKGRDADFSRGESSWDRYGLGGSRKKNPSLGKVDKAPYWAVAVYPGDTGTKGGLVVDADAVVRRVDGSPVTGLYACGGAAASLSEHTAPGPGAGLAEAMVQAYRAVLDIHARR